MRAKDKATSYRLESSRGAARDLGDEEAFKGVLRKLAKPESLRVFNPLLVV